MSYRKITVDGNTYEYTVGTTFTKVKVRPGLNWIYENELIGNRIGMRYVVSPENVRRAILGLPVPTFTCEEHGVTTTEMAYDPFCVEIEGKRHLVVNCPECLERRSWDI